MALDLDVRINSEPQLTTHKRIDFMERVFRQSARGFLFHHGIPVWLSLCLLLCGLPSAALAQSQQPATNAPQTQGQAEQPADPQTAGSISGTVVYQEGSPIGGARVTLTRPGLTSPSQETTTGDEGQFEFDRIAPGPFRLTVTGEDFGTQTFSGELHPQEAFLVPQIMLHIATVVTEIRVVPPEEIAQQEVRQAEKQRILGVIPNFYVSFDSDPVPLRWKQKFSLAWKSVLDPTTFVGAAAVAGINQASDRFPSYRQGAEGYAKRFGASYADIFDGTVIGSALMPSLLRQDPRYFYKGTGSKRSRLLYAMSNSIISKGDNGKWQPNYSGISGGLITGSIANAYYPEKNRGVGLVFSVLAIRMAESSFTGIFDEFVSRKITSNVPPSARNQP
jgi:carboxypeptidase family protein